MDSRSQTRPRWTKVLDVFLSRGDWFHRRSFTSDLLRNPNPLWTMKLPWDQLESQENFLGKTTAPIKIRSQSIFPSSGGTRSIVRVPNYSTSSMSAFLPLLLMETSLDERTPECLFLPPMPPRCKDSAISTYARGLPSLSEKLISRLKKVHWRSPYRPTCDFSRVALPRLDSDPLKTQSIQKVLTRRYSEELDLLISLHLI